MTCNSIFASQNLRLLAFQHRIANLYIRYKSAGYTIRVTVSLNGVASKFKDKISRDGSETSDVCI